VKIDGAFIDNLAQDFIDQRIVGSICEIAQATNARTIAEHVKDYETFSLLRDLGVDYGQGFFLGKPAAKLRFDSMPVSISARNRRAG
jgi:EAL domain-containing protein (putative c-di-GMP-specific phosphodiesterase class I)